MLENMRLSLQGILSHKMRSALTMLGIIIGIASIIAIVSTMKGTNEQIKQNLIGSGNNVVEVEFCEDGNPYYISMYQALPDGITEISERTRRELMEVEHSEGVSLYYQMDYAGEDLYYKNESFDSSIIGADQNYLDVYGYQVTAGRPFTEQDYSARHKVVLIDEATAAQFGGTDMLGETVEINREPFQIIGIITEKNKRETVINSYSDYYTYNGDQRGKFIIPSTTWSIVYPLESPQNAALRAETTDDMTAVGQAAQDILGAAFPNLDSSYSYACPELQEAAQKLQDLSDTSGKQLIWIAGISLIVGAIGVMNIMLVSVTERTREVGLKKALGAKKRVILGQFLIEASVLTCIGGIIGVVSGLVLSKIISILTGTPTAVSIPAILAAVALSIGIGVVSGVFPAVKAANLNPIDALRRD